MQFNNYIVDEIKYLKNNNFVPDKSRKLDTPIDCFSTIFYPENGNNGIIKIKVILGNLKKIVHRFF